MNVIALLLAAAIQPLWPEGKMPDCDADQIAAPSQEVRKPGFDRAAHRMPYLEWSEAPKGPKTDACVILISGGGYNSTCDGPAFKQLERKMLDNGITCVWLWYRTPRPKNLPIHQTAWEDGQRAVRLVRAAAKERGYDPEKIGVLGCSAGSHLCLLLGTSALTPAYAPVDATDSVPCHVNWAIPMCPAYALTDGLGCENKTKGNGADVKLDTIFKFDAKTCPMCFFHGGKDPYSPIASTRVYRELRKRKIPAELHLDAGRGHGPVKADAFERALEFMRQMGYLGRLGREVNHDHRWLPNDTLRTEKRLLWPEGKTPDPMDVHGYKSYLVWFVPEKLTTKAIQIVYPGGGYKFCNFNGEGTPVAHYLNGKGMTCVVVMYRCPRPTGGKPKHWSAWQDAQRAIRLVRAEAPKRGLDPNRIGVMGFSAGGHLALMTATNAKTPAYAPVDEIDTLPCTVQWACPTYPAYALTDGLDQPNVGGGNGLDVRTAPEFSFDADTPPMCFSHGDADAWAAMNSVVAWERLRRQGVQCDLHTYAKRGHCFQICAAPGTGSYSWLDRLWEFLAKVGCPDVPLFDRLSADLARPLLKDRDGALWDAQLDEVRRLDEAADARWAACKTPDEVKAHQDDLKAKMTAAVGGFPARVPLNPVVTATVPRDGYRIEKVYFESQPKFYETGLFYRPDGAGPFPAIAITCGHSGDGKGSRDYQRACVLAAKAGIAAFIYDPVDQGERTQLKEKGGNVHGHNRIGLRAALLGWSMARFRVWDAMRALDYLASRPDVDANRLGFMGNSGGGTLTSLTMALDGRIVASAPSCYLSTLRHVCEDCGPQDAEQNIFGQLAFGLNHLGYVAMRAPKPTLMVCKTKDFFPIRGSLATQKIAEGVFGVAGNGAAYDLFVSPGPHGWVESTRTGSVAWMRRWLKGETAAFSRDLFPDFIAKDQGFAITNVDFGLKPGYEVSPEGNVRNLPGAVTAYDLMRREAERQAAARGPVTPETVRKVAGIRAAAELPEAKLAKGEAVKGEGYRWADWRFDLGRGVVLTAKAVQPSGQVQGAPVLVLPSTGRAQAAAKVAELVAANRAVLVADVRGAGETGKVGHRFYGSDYPEEGIAAMVYLTGKNLVAERAEDILVLARALAREFGANAVEAISIGRTAIPLAHATAVERELFAKRTYVNAPDAWREWFKTDATTVHYTDLVNGAYGAYDWTDL